MEIIAKMTQEQLEAAEAAGIQFETVYKNPVAYKIWQDEDVASVIREEGYLVSPTNIADVINSGALDELSDCTDSDWNIISRGVCEALEGKENEVRNGLKAMYDSIDIAETDELDFYTSLLEKGYTLDDIQEYMPECYESAKLFCKEHGLV